MALLSMQDVSVAFGGPPVLDRAALHIERGERVCLLGRNGVGKTTTMRSIMGLTPPASGTVRWKGQDITRWPPHRVQFLM